MTRRLVLAVTAVLVLGGAAGAPAVAEEPVTRDDGKLTFCVLAGPAYGKEGLCVWVPDPR